MKKIYAILVLMLAFCGFSANAQVVTKLSDKPVSSINEGDLLAFKNTVNDLFLYNNDYVDRFTDEKGEWYDVHHWRLRFKNSDIEAALGSDASMQYVYKVVDLDNNGGFKLQAQSGDYIPVLDNNEPGSANYLEAEGETFSLEYGSTTKSFYIKGSQGQYFGLDTWGEKLQGTEKEVEFEIYKAELGEAAPKVNVTFQFYDIETSEEIQGYADQVMSLSIGTKVTVPTIRFYWSCVEGYDINDETKTVVAGEEIEVTEEVTYALVFKAWPWITVNYVDADGNALTNKDGEVATNKFQPMTASGTKLNVGQLQSGVPEGYYVSDEEMFKHQGTLVPQEDSVINVVCTRSTMITMNFVDENGNEIREPKVEPGRPGENIFVESIEWYTLDAADSIYVYDWNTNTGYLIGTQDTTITFHYNSSFPFETTTVVDGLFAADTKWYGIQFMVPTAFNDWGEATAFDYQYMFYEEGSVCVLDRAEAVEDAMLWAFVGDRQDGYVLYNKAAGPGMKLYVEGEINSMSTGAEPKMNAENGTKFEVKQSYTGAAVFGILFKGEDGWDYYACLNNLGGEGNVLINAGRYGALSSDNSFVNIVPETNVTGIEGVVAAPTEADNAIYDLSGRRVFNPGKGLYIQNGKVVLK